MKDIILTNAERNTILQGLVEGKRLDLRGIFDYRRMKIAFGVDRGCCHVELGRTRVMAVVSCEVVAPRFTRESEGMLRIFVELSPMAHRTFEAGRQSDLAAEINRLLEKTIRESRALDQESLCIRAGLKVFAIRVDVQVCNHDGNILDCACVAAMAALSHFRRPDVSVSGEDVVIHSSEEKDPVPLAVHHIPLCVTCAWFKNGHYLLVDPTELEERCMEGKVVVGMNMHREICCLHLSGSMLIVEEQVTRCTHIATSKILELTDFIKEALANDELARKSGGKFGFAEKLPEFSSALVSKQDGGLHVDLLEKAPENIRTSHGKSVISDDEDAEDMKVERVMPGTAHIGEGGASSWRISDDDEMEQVVESSSLTAGRHTSDSKLHGNEEDSEGSEEGELVMLDEEERQINRKNLQSSKASWSRQK